MAAAAGPAAQPRRSRRGRHARTGRRAGAPRLLALHAGQQPGRVARHQPNSTCISRVIATGRPPLRSTEDICPKCKAPLPPGEDECPICNRELTVAPLTWTLFRLWRFARPYRWQLLSGFALTLAATAATLVPPYLTMPLMDNVLIPFQNGKPIDWPLVGLYLSGLFGSALLAWLLGWIRTYILALDVGAHRPRPAHPHLRAPARPVARIFRRQTHRRPDGADRQRDRPHQRLPLARPAQLRHRRADDRDDGGHPVLDQPVAGAGHPAAAADHRLDDPLRPRKAAHRLREDRPRLGRGHQRAGRHHPRHPRRQGLRPGKARGASASAPPTSTTWR